VSEGPVRRAVPHGLPGLLVTFEGPEGSGKSTLIRGLADALAATGIEPLLLREPGGSPVGERIRDILLDPGLPELLPETELMLMVASRAQLVRERIRPALAAGRLVLCDRYADASVAYQGGGRGLPYSTVHDLNNLAVAGTTPDLTFLCLLPPEVGRARMGGRDRDRLEREPDGFHARVYDAYRGMGESGEGRFHVLDAGAAPEAVLAGAMARLRLLEHELLNDL